MASESITILPENRIIVRTSSVWYMVTIRYCKEQMNMSKSLIWKTAYDKAKKEYKDKYEEN